MTVLAQRNRRYEFDALTEMKDAGAITASAAAQVGGVDKVLEIGPGRFDGVLVIDISAVDIADGDELYTILVQGSNDATPFSTLIQNLVAIDVGAAAARLGGANVPASVGSLEAPFQNIVDDLLYENIRVWTEVAGTTPSIDYTARVGTVRAFGG